MYPSGLPHFCHLMLVLCVSPSSPSLYRDHPFCTATCPLLSVPALCLHQGFSFSPMLSRCSICPLEFHSYFFSFYHKLILWSLEPFWEAGRGKSVILMQGAHLFLYPLCRQSAEVADSVSLLIKAGWIIARLHMSFCTPITYAILA